MKNTDTVCHRCGGTEQHHPACHHEDGSKTRFTEEQVKAIIMYENHKTKQQVDEAKKRIKDNLFMENRHKYGLPMYFIKVDAIADEVPTESNIEIQGSVEWELLDYPSARVLFPANISHQHAIILTQGILQALRNGFMEESFEVDVDQIAIEKAENIKKQSANAPF